MGHYSLPAATYLFRAALDVARRRIFNNATYLFQARCHLSRPMPLISSRVFMPEIFNNATYLFQISGFDATYLDRPMPVISSRTVVLGVGLGMGWGLDPDPNGVSLVGENK